MITVTIKDVQKKDLFDLVNKLAGYNLSFKVEEFAEGIAMSFAADKKAKKRKKRNGKRLEATDIILLNDIERATPGTLYEKAVNTLQQLEKKRGIGSITRADLTKALSSKMKAPSAAIGDCYRLGIIKRG